MYVDVLSIGFRCNTTISGNRFHTLTPVSKAALLNIAVHKPHREETMAGRNLGRIELNTTYSTIFTQTQRLSLILPRLLNCCTL